MFVEIVVVDCQKCNDFSHGVIRRPVFAKIDCFLEKLQRGVVMSDLKIFIADFLTCWDLHLTKIKYVKKTYMITFSQTIA